MCVCARAKVHANNSGGDCGRHYFSTNGDAGTWHVAPLPPADLGGCAFPRADVPFRTVDGHGGTATRRSDGTRAGANVSAV